MTELLSRVSPDIATALDAIEAQLHEMRSLKGWRLNLIRENLAKAKAALRYDAQSAAEPDAWLYRFRVNSGWSGWFVFPSGADRQMHDAIEYRPLYAVHSSPAGDGAWQPIETAPKNQGLIDIWTVGWGADPLRVADCYYDQICDEWRTSRPAGQLLCIKKQYVTHWRPRPTPPMTSTHRGGGK